MEIVRDSWISEAYCLRSSEAKALKVRMIQSLLLSGRFKSTRSCILEELLSENVRTENEKKK